MESQPTSQTAETYLYRIMPLRYFLQMLEKEVVYLPRISKWTDTYELFLFKQYFVDSGGKEIAIPLQPDNIYGQCWSSARKSEALWRIYSPDRYSVQIKTTAKQLEEWAKTYSKNGLLLEFGEIKYYTERKLNEWILSVTASTLENKLIESLFIKRDSFSHEKEYRVIAYPAHNSNLQEGSSKIPFYEDNHLEIPMSPLPIYEVSLDPRLSEEECRFLKDAISLRIGGKCRVSQSTLYKFKQKIITI